MKKILIAVLLAILGVVFFVVSADAQGINGALIYNGSVTVAKISASGTAGSTTFLRGDGSWQVLNGFTPQTALVPDAVAVSDSSNVVTASPFYGTHSEPNGQIYEWQVETATTPPVYTVSGFTGGDSGLNGSYGYTGTTHDGQEVFVQSGGSYAIFHATGTSWIGGGTYTGWFIGTAVTYTVSYASSTSSGTAPLGPYYTYTGGSTTGAATGAQVFVGPDGTQNSVWCGSVLVSGNGSVPSLSSGASYIIFQCRALGDYTSGGTPPGATSWVQSGSTSYAGVAGAYTGAAPISVSGTTISISNATTSATGAVQLESSSTDTSSSHVVTANDTRLANGGNSITALTGDVTASGPGSAAATLATVNSSPGTTGDNAHTSHITTNAKGLVTANTSVAISPTAIGAESALGNPSTNGYVLSSTTSGTRSWVAQSSGGVSSLNSLTGALSIGAGTGITVTPSGSTVTIAASGGSGGVTVTTSLPTPASGNRGGLYLLSQTGNSPPIGDTGAAVLISCKTAGGYYMFRNLTTGNGYLPGLAAQPTLWLAADTIDATANSGNVTSWKDLSGNTNTVTNVSGTPTLVTNDINGLPAVKFTGSQIMATGSLVAPNGTFDLYVVAYSRSSTGDQHYASNFYGATNAYGGGLGNYMGNFHIFGGNGTTSLPINSISSSMSNAAHILEFHVGSSAQSGWQDGTQDYTSTALPSLNGTTKLSIGGNYYAYGGATEFATADIAEVLYFSTAQSSGDVATTRSYLRTKYATY